MEKYEAALNKANSRLKSGRIKVMVQARGDRLLLRGTFPPKPMSSKERPYQQRLALGLPFNMIGIDRAEAEAKRIGALLALGKFDWAEFHDGPEIGSIDFWLKKFEQQFWLERSRNNSSERTWKTYEQVLKHLPKKELLSVDQLIMGVRHSKPDTRSRQRYCMVLSKLARFAGLDDSKIKSLRGGYGLTSVEPRTLPSEELIFETWESIKSPAWRWVFGMLATYGIRPHEVFGLDLSEWPTIYTHPESKTGSRFVYPVPPDWVDRFQLGDFLLPAIAELDHSKEDWDFSKLGSKVSCYFRKRSFPFNPYSLRHCYARKCFEQGIDSDFGAKLMGHSVKLHTETYRQFWEQGTYRARYDRLFKPDS